MITGHRQLATCPPVGLSVECGPDVDPVRRLATTAAASQGFDQTHTKRVALVATGMATHLVRHGGTGRIHVQLVERGDLRGVELVGMDHAATDNADRPWAVANTPGATPDEDLGAVDRASDLFDAWHVVGRGTVMMARLWGGRPTGTSESRFLVGSMADAIPGEYVSGDAWAVEQQGPRAVALVADGLGHGENAARASAAAVEAFRRHHQEPVEDIAGHIHRALLGTRGAAIAVAEVDLGLARIRFCGIGNIAARLTVAGGHTGLVSHFGIAGYQSPRIQAFEKPWEDGALLVMHSDGLSPKWDLDAYDDLHRHHPQLAAAAVMRDSPRLKDDALVLALRGADETIRATLMEAG